jgi:hypothetical protein
MDPAALGDDRHRARSSARAPRTQKASSGSVRADGTTPRAGRSRISSEPGSASKASLRPRAHDRAQGGARVRAGFRYPPDARDPLVERRSESAGARTNGAFGDRALRYRVYRMRSGSKPARPPCRAALHGCARLE